MHKLRTALAALPLVCLSFNLAAAGDLYEAEVEGVIVEDDRPVVVERERIIERRYYPRGDAEDALAVEVYEAPHRHAYYPDRYSWRARDGW